MTKRLLFVVNVDWFFKSHRLPIALKAIEQGYEVHLACLDTGDFAELSQLGIHCHYIEFSRSGANPARELAAMRQLYQVLKDVNADIVHTVTIKPALYVGLLSKLVHIPALVFAISGLGLMFSSDGHTVKRTLIKWLYRLALSHKNKTIIFQNPSDKQQLLSVLKEPDDVAQMIKGSGADLTEFDYVKEPIVEEEAGICSPVRVAMAARLLKDKGVYDFVEAAKRLSSKPHVNIQFVLIGGPDPDNPTSVSMGEFEAWQQASFIEVVGPSNEVEKHFANSHIVVLPSYYGEGLPKVLIEAAAIGRAVITTDNPGCKEAVIENETALIVPARDIDALTQAIESLAKDHHKRRLMGKRGRALAEAEFDVNKVAERHIKIYEELGQ